MAEELGERTEEPTGRRLSEARSRGQVAKSQDLASAIDLIGAAILVLLGGGAALSAMGVMLRRVLEDQTAGETLSVASLKPEILWIAGQAVRIAGPALLVMFVIACAAHVSQIGWVLTSYPITPKLERLNPVAGLKKLFNARNLVKTVVNTVKLIMVAVIAYLIFDRRLAAMAALPQLTMLAAMYQAGLMVLELTAWLLVLFLAIGLIDLLFQRWNHRRDLKMTRQEVKDERRSVDGDPEVKSRRLRMAREITMQRIQQAVPKADVVVTNPTHFSVALKYDAANMRAPKVVAKGADFLAFKIRNVAIASGVPIIERPPLARGLYWGVEVGQEISPEHYEAVAEVLAYVYRLKGRAA